MQFVVEEDRGLVANGGLGDHVPGAGDVARFEVFEAYLAGEDAPVCKAYLLEEHQVYGVVNVAVGIKVSVTDRKPHDGLGGFQMRSFQIWFS